MFLKLIVVLHCPSEFYLYVFLFVCFLCIYLFVCCCVLIYLTTQNILASAWQHLGNYPEDLSNRITMYDYCFEHHTSYLTNTRWQPPNNALATTQITQVHSNMLKMLQNTIATAWQHPGNHTQHTVFAWAGSTH